MKVVKKMKQNRTIPKMFFNEHEHEGDFLSVLKKMKQNRSILKMFLKVTRFFVCVD